MTHEFAHIIECGSVGATIGEPVSPGQWPKHSTGFVAFKAGDERIERMADPVIRKIARMIGRLTGSEVHDMQDVSGGYCGIGIGDPEGPIDIPPLPQYSDLFLTVIFLAPEAPEAEVAALMAEITIERAELYLKVYKKTGGVIHLSYGVHHEDVP